jgi:hypothetical protein
MRRTTKKIKGDDSHFILAELLDAALRMDERRFRLCLSQSNPEHDEPYHAMNETVAFISHVRSETHRAGHILLMNYLQDPLVRKNCLEGHPPNRDNQFLQARTVEDVELMNATRTSDVEGIRSSYRRGGRNHRAGWYMEESAVHTASFAGNYKILDILLDQEPSAVNRPRICLGYYTPLHLAVLGGHVEAVAVILRHMPELEILDHTNRTAVHLAMECMLPEDHILRSTLAYQLRKTHCSPPITAEGDLPEIFHMLLDARANIDAKGTEDGLTCLHIACMYGINCAARSLIEHGADVDAASNIGFTPLHCAVVASDQSTVIQLLSVGANIHAVAEDIGTACALAYKTWGNASNTEENSLKERKRKCFEALDACHRAARVGPYTAVNLIEGGGVGVHGPPI